MLERDGHQYVVFMARGQLCCVDDQGFTAPLEPFNMRVLDCAPNRGILLDEVRRRLSDPGAYCCLEAHGDVTRYACRAAGRSFDGRTEFEALTNALTRTSGTP
jgi:hypothetical protein